MVTASISSKLDATMFVNSVLVTTEIVSVSVPETGSTMVSSTAGLSGSTGLTMAKRSGYARCTSTA